MKHHFVSILLVIAAITCYAVGAAVPGIALFILGGIAELLFWLRIFGSSQHNEKP